VPDRRFLEAAKGSPRLVEPLSVGGADRLGLTEGGRKIAGAGLALAVEEGAARAYFTAFSFSAPVSRISTTSSG
jgi:hypothetical protein